MNAIRESTKHRTVATLGEDPRYRLVNVLHDTANAQSGPNGFGSDTGQILAELVIAGREREQIASASTDAVSWPTMRISGAADDGRGLYGTQALLAEHRPISRVSLGDQIVGSTWSDEDADYCLLAGVLPGDALASRGSQTTDCLEQMERAFALAGMEFRHLVRTWFYLDNLLEWYDEFNAARTSFFKSRRVFDGLIPASTGIGARNGEGKALVAGALAVRPRTDRVHIQEIKSPLQCSATEYRSSFSRAVEVESRSSRLLIISGTASIAPNGESLFADDVVKQIDRALDVVEALLHSRGMNWGDTKRGIAYFRDLEAFSAFEACCRERNISPLPVLPVQLIVCRDDLLFEIELDAACSLFAEGHSVPGDASR